MLYVKMQLRGTVPVFASRQTQYRTELKSIASVSTLDQAPCPDAPSFGLPP